MLKMRTKPTTLPPAMTNGGGGGGGGGDSGGHDWEMRPGGMLVQKRNPDSDRAGTPTPMIRVRIKYGTVYHEINISPQATFGELKKMLSGPTGIHHQDQKIMYKDKERDSKAFLDNSGVKDKSKMVLMEDPISQEKRLLEMRKKAKTERASKAISDISFEVDRLAGRVSALETVISKGGRIAEKDLVNLIELLMNELLKLDGIVAEGDVKLQRKMQVRRVQNYVETLDALKIKNSTADGGEGGRQRHADSQRSAPPPTDSLMDMPVYENKKQEEIQEQEPHHHHHHHQYHHHHHHHHQQEQQQKKQELQRNSSGSGPFLVTTKWETFDATPPRVTSTVMGNGTDRARPARFDWELFD